MGAQNDGVAWLIHLQGTPTTGFMRSDGSRGVPVWWRHDVGWLPNDGTYYTTAEKEQTALPDGGEWVQVLVEVMA